MRICFRGLYLFFLLTSCTDFSSEKLLINESFVAEKLAGSSLPMESVLFQSDLNMQFTASDYLPAGWDIANELLFFELDRIKGAADSVEMILYARVVEKNQKIWDVRVATVSESKVRYNFPVWQNDFKGQNNTIISKSKGTYTAEILLEGEPVAIYFMESGQLE